MSVATFRFLEVSGLSYGLSGLKVCPGTRKRQYWEKNHDACAGSYQSQTVKKNEKKPKTRWSNFFGDVFWAKRKDQNILYNPTYRFSVLSLNTNAIKQSVLKSPSKQGNFRHKQNFNKSVGQDVPNNALRTLVLYSLL